MEQLGFFAKQPTSCVFTGHRDLEEDFSARKLKKAIKNFLEKGVRIFYNGFALGFDTEALKILLSFKKKYPDIKLIACIPCPTQYKYFNEKEKKVYRALLAQADEKVLVSEEYTKGCMLKRNRYMADRADCMITYCKKDKGGTVYTVKYFQKINPCGEIIFL
ncbi:MAG: DUF1273 family protein [Clostridia bacterium]|nr:DUF1273 family protein [Clostridia bacterium]